MGDAQTAIVGQRYITSQQQPNRLVIIYSLKNRAIEGIM